jgi:hypothetical protein
MGAKYKNLVKLYDGKINVHEFKEVINIKELLAYSLDNSKFSVRFDRDSDYHKLPFYKFDKSDFDNERDIEVYFNEIILEAIKLNCTLLCSNGYLYDDIQICNFVIKIDNSYDFILEWSTKKVALREMYQYQTTVLKGNLKSDLKYMEWTFKDENKIDDKDIEKILNWAFNMSITNKNIEGTLYPTKVGMLNSEIVCWQID